MELFLGFLKRIYSRIGHKGIMALIYVLFLAVHLVLSAFSHLPSIDPNEFSVSAIATFLSGGDWSAAMSQNTYYYGFLQSAVYSPVMFLCDDPYLSYKLMLWINAVIMSFIPVMAYSIAYKIGAKKPWQAGFCATICGAFSTYFAHANFIWNEVLSIFFPWFIAWVMFRCFERSEGKKPSFFYSVLLGVVTALSCAAHFRLAAVVLAVAVTVIASRIFLKRKIVRLVPFFVSLVLFGVLVMFGTYAVQIAVWGTRDASLINTPQNFFSTFSAEFSENGIAGLFIALVGQLFYFFSSTWGLGALAATLSVFLVASFFSRRKKGLYQEYSDGVLIFGCLSSFIVIFTLAVSVLYKYGSDPLRQDSLIFGRYLDAVSPFAVMLVLVVTFIYGTRLRHILCAVGVQLFSTVSFAVAVLPLLTCAVSTRMSPTLSVYPLLIGQDNSSLLDFTSFLSCSSCPLCVLAVLIVVSTCKEYKTRSVITAFLSFGITVYSAVCVCVTYIPLTYAESLNKNSVYEDISEHIYNHPEAPDVTAYRTTRNTVQMLQFLNGKITVSYAGEVGEIKDDTIVIVPEGEIVRFPTTDKKITFSKLAVEGDYEIYVYGERALAYIESQK